MQFGMNVPIFGEYADVRLLAELAVEAEESGWDGFWVWDHLQWSGEDDGGPRQPAVDPTVALALIAAATSRVRLGPMVMPLARRRPWKAARELTTLDHLSSGRLTLGVGLGGPPGPGVRRLRGGDRRPGPRRQARRGPRRAGRDVDRSAVRLRRDAAPTVLGSRCCRDRCSPRVPIWVGGEWPAHRAPFRRAARFDGVHPCCSRCRRTSSPRRSATWFATSAGSAPMISRSTSRSGLRPPATEVWPTGISSGGSPMPASPGGWSPSRTGAARWPRCGSGSVGVRPPDRSPPTLVACSGRRSRERLRRRYGSRVWVRWSPPWSHHGSSRWLGLSADRARRQRCGRR